MSLNFHVVFSKKDLHLDLHPFVRTLVRLKVPIIQIREKNLTLNELNLYLQQFECYLNAETKFLINDYWKLARKNKLAGYHLGQSDLPSALKEKIDLNQHAVFGLTLENYRDFENCKHLSPTYFGLSSIYSTATKPEAKPFWSKEQVSKLRAETSIPLIGIGGVNLKNLKQTLKLGIDGVAMSSQITGVKSLFELERTVIQIMEIMKGWENEENSINRRF